MTRTTTAAAALSACAAISISACGGSDSASGADAQAKAERAQLKFAQCMRRHGVDVPDPKPDRKGPGLVRIGKGISPQVMQRADAACRRYLQAAMPKLSAAERAELRDQAVKFARCMREHGVDMPDPEVSGGGFRMTLRRGQGGNGGNLNPDSPAFKDAQEACKAFQPKPPGRN